MRILHGLQVVRFLLFLLYKRPIRTGMVECSKEGEKNSGIHNTLAETGGNDVGKVLPRRVVELYEHDHQVANAHEQGSSTYEIRKLSPTRHDNARNESSNWSSK